MYDVEAVRAQFPALAEGTAHFDGPGGSQTPRPVAEAIAAALLAGVSNRGHVTAAEKRADKITLDARQAMADLLGADPGGVVFGRSMTQLTYDFSRTLAKTWRPGDEVVVTRLDHDANIRPWVQAAAAVGATVRWADFDPETGELAAEAVAGQISERTRLVAVTGASNLLGTKPDVRAISDAAHRVGALCYVDGVHLTPHSTVDVAALGADLFACSPYKFCGPHMGALAAAPALLDRLRPDKLLPSSDAVPERFEFGTLPYELLAGVRAAVDFLAGLVPGDGDRRARLLRSYGALDAHESAMQLRLEDGLDAIGGITRHGAAARRTPLVLFSKAGVASADIYRALAACGVNAPAGSFYAIECSRRLGLGDGGAVRAGIAPYTTAEDVERLLDGVAAVSAGPTGPDTSDGTHPAGTPGSAPAGGDDLPAHHVRVVAGGERGAAPGSDVIR
jgi:cysteine desulfurase family protein (TIGR01976 family)